MKFLLTTVLTLFIISCRTEVKEAPDKDKKVPDPDKKIIATISKDSTQAEVFYEQFEKYLDSKKVQTIDSLNNIDFKLTDISIKGHHIQWFDSEDRTRIKIDNNLFILDNYITLNPVTDTDKDSLSFPNNWDKIKLYKIPGKQTDIILITMAYHPCTGLGCSLEYILIYDTATKTKNFFGSFRGAHSSELYDFGNQKLSFLSSTYIGDLHMATTVEYVTNIYEHNSDGRFSIKTDNNKKPYFIINTWYPATKKDSLEVSWPFEIK